MIHPLGSIQAGAYDGTSQKALPVLMTVLLAFSMILAVAWLAMSIAQAALDHEAPFRGLDEIAPQAEFQT